MTLTRKFIKNIYFSFVYSYLNYANIALANTNLSKLEKLWNKQKHAIRIIYGEERTTHAKLVMKSLISLDIYPFNILFTLTLMFKIKNKMAPNVFTTSINQSSHMYPTRCSNINFNQPTIKNKFTILYFKKRTLPSEYIFDQGN